MYDLHNQVLFETDPSKLERFKLDGVGVLFKNKFSQSKFDEIKEKIKSSGSDLDLIPAVEIKKGKEGQIKNAVRRARKKADVVFVSSKDKRAMRAAPGIEGVDAISHAFVDQSSARDCAENNVALEINLKDLLSLYGMKKANLISKIKFNLELSRKYGVPLIFTTGAKEIYGMRSPRQLTAFAQSIGFTAEEAKEAVLKTPKKIVKRNGKGD